MVPLLYLLVEVPVEAITSVTAPPLHPGICPLSTNELVVSTEAKTPLYTMTEIIISPPAGQMFPDVIAFPNE